MSKFDIVIYRKFPDNHWIPLQPDDIQQDGFVDASMMVVRVDGVMAFHSGGGVTDNEKTEKTETNDAFFERYVNEEGIHPSEKKFRQIIRDVVDLHEKKGHDYGFGDDPFKNVRGSQEYGVSPWVGVSIRKADKEVRVKAFLEKGQLINESLEDAMIDDIVYGVIRLVLYRETKDG